MARRLTAALALVVGLLLGAGRPADAGGGRMAPVQDRYEPGEVATLVGYTGDPVLTALPEEPFYAYLRPSDSGSTARLLRTDLYVGELAVEETAHRGYLRFRVSITFPLPAGLEPGHYDLVYCTDPCTSAFLGDLVGQMWSGALTGGPQAGVDVLVDAEVDEREGHADRGDAQARGQEPPPLALAEGALCAGLVHGLAEGHRDGGVGAHVARTVVGADAGH